MFLGRSHRFQSLPPRIAVSAIPERATANVISDLAGFAVLRISSHVLIFACSTIRLRGRWTRNAIRKRRKSTTQRLVSHSYLAKAGPSGKDVCFRAADHKQWWKGIRTRRNGWKSERARRCPRIGSRASRGKPLLTVLINPWTAGPGYSLARNNENSTMNAGVHPADGRPRKPSAAKSWLKAIELTSHIEDQPHRLFADLSRIGRGGSRTTRP